MNSENWSFIIPLGLTTPQKCGFLEAALNEVRKGKHWWGQSRWSVTALMTSCRTFTSHISVSFSCRHKVFHPPDSGTWVPLRTYPLPCDPPPDSLRGGRGVWRGRGYCIILLKLSSVYLVSCPDLASHKEKGLVIIEWLLGCADSAVSNVVTLLHDIMPFYSPKSRLSTQHNQEITQ